MVLVVQRTRMQVTIEPPSLPLGLTSRRSRPSQPR
jgi:hypothetical protein